MPKPRIILRLWGQRLFWLLVAAALTVAVVYAPTGLVMEQNGWLNNVASQTTKPRTAGDPLLIEPYRGDAPATAAWRWDWAQYRENLTRYVTSLVRGDLQYLQGRAMQPVPAPVLPLIRTSWLNSLKVFLAALTAGTVLGALAGGLTLGSRWGRSTALALSVGGLALPDFFFVLMGQMLTIWTYKHFEVRLWSVGVPGADRAWLLPVLALSIAPFGYIARLTMTALDEVTREDYIRTARSKGLPEFQVIFRHAFANALPRVLNGLPTMVNVTLSSLVVVELMTTWPGVARLTLGGEGTQPPVAATAGLVFCVWFALLDGLFHTLRIVANPRLGEVAA